jgi:Bifunctional DNA primase/polymerase, N-terminal
MEKEESVSAERIDNESRLEPLLQLYLRRHWMVFPCAWYGAREPLVKGGFHAASRDPGVVFDWWQREPRALVAMPTGRRPQGNGFAVVDVDRKNGKDGFKTLAELLGTTALPLVPRVHTPSGGLHLYYQAPPNGCHSTIDKGGKIRPGLGSGVDFKADRSQVHAPGGSPSSPYRWDDQCNLLTIPQLMPLPAVLIPVEVEISDEEDAAPAPDSRPASGKLVDLYAKAAIAKTCDRIRAAVPGVQRKTLNDESFQMGSLAAGLGLDHQAIRAQLIGAGLAMQQQAGRDAWTRHDVKKTVEDGFRDGLRKPYRPRIGGRR